MEWAKLQMDYQNLHYNVIEIQSRVNLWYFYCVKLNDGYRYYGIVYDSDKEDVLVSLMDHEYNVIDHFSKPKANHSHPSELFLELCVDYDKFWFPELFENNLQSVDN